MQRRLIVLSLLLLADCDVTLAESPGLATRPNVIVILTDDQGYDDVGYHGNPWLRTPHIDRLAHEGLRMDAFRVNAPLCSPSRGCLLTGRWPDRNGVVRVLVDETDQDGLNREEVTLGEHLAAHGYRIGLVGKWHVGQQEYNLPWNRGYDTRACLLSGQIGNTFFDPRVWYGRLGEEAVRVHKEGYYTDIITADALAFLQEDSDKPFFLWLAHHAPHNPLSAPEDRTARCLKRLPESMPSERRDMLAQHNAMIEVVDDGVGSVMALLKERGLDRNTLVMYLSDNGGLLPRGIVNVPFRGGKGQLWEGGVRVPFIASWPGRIEAGGISQAEMSGIDLLPTVCEAIGLPTPPDRELDGVSFWNVWQGNADVGPDRRLFSIAGFGARRYENRPIHPWYDDHPRTVQRAVWWKNWKYMFAGKNADQGYEVLFDLSRPEVYAEWEQSLPNPDAIRKTRMSQQIHQDGRAGSMFYEIEDVKQSQPEVMRQMREAMADWSDEVLK